MAADLKLVYGAATEYEAEQALVDFGEAWDKQFDWDCSKIREVYPWNLHFSLKNWFLTQKILQILTKSQESYLIMDNHLIINLVYDNGKAV